MTRAGNNPEKPLQEAHPHCPCLCPTMHAKCDAQAQTTKNRKATGDKKEKRRTWARHHARARARETRSTRATQTQLRLMTRLTRLAQLAQLALPTELQCSTLQHTLGTRHTARMRPDTAGTLGTRTAHGDDPTLPTLRGQPAHRAKTGFAREERPRHPHMPLPRAGRALSKEK
jgi:hypothetical protein